MTEQYKVLNAMLAFKEFTVRDIVRVSRVNPTTVRTVINRRADLLEPKGLALEGHRGGSYRKYAFLPGKYDVLRLEVDRAFADLRKARFEESAADTGNVNPPFGLLTAEDILKRRYREAKETSEKQHLLKIAKIDLQGARQEIESHSGMSDSSSKQLLCQVETLEQEIEQQQNSLEALAELKAALETGESRKIVISKLLEHVRRAAASISNLVARSGVAMAETRSTVRVFADPVAFTRKITMYADKRSSAWTREISEILTQHQASVTVLKEPILKRKVSCHVVGLEENIQDVLFLAIDSESDASRAEMTCKQVLDVCKPRRFYVFDAGANAELCEQIRERQGNYQPWARGLPKDELLSMLNMDALVQPTPRIEAAEELSVDA